MRVKMRYLRCFAHLRFWWRHVDKRLWLKDVAYDLKAAMEKDYF